MFRLNFISTFVPPFHFHTKVSLSKSQAREKNHAPYRIGAGSLAMSDGARAENRGLMIKNRPFGGKIKFNNEIYLIKLFSFW